MEEEGIVVKKMIQDFQRKLAPLYPVHEIRQIIYILFEEYLGWHKTKVHLSFDAEIPEMTMNSFAMALEELQKGKPIQYVLNKSVFNGTILQVDGRVLVPRPETEQLCSIVRADFIEKQHRQMSVLDIGTGSGCIAIDLSKYFSHAAVSATDVSEGALENARINARLNNCEISFFQNDILIQSAWLVHGKYDIIISNPPYVLESEKVNMHRNVLEFEPVNALFVPDEDPLVFYKAISSFAKNHLESPGYLYFEINEQFGSQVSELVRSEGLTGIRILPDFHGKERFVAAVFQS